jgi:F0F1-type ATP synthase membrane subunit c/vacuolar-type H+-ATPase subunit K
VSGGQPPAETSAGQLRRGYWITTVIGGAMLASLAFYVLVVEIIRANRLAPPGLAGDDPTVLRYLFVAVGVAMLVMARVERARMLAASTGVAETRIAAGRLQTATIVSLAASEAVAILGLVLFFLTGHSRDFYLFLAPAVLGFILNFPRWSHWEEAARPPRTARP